MQTIEKLKIVAEKARLDAINAVEGAIAVEVQYQESLKVALPTLIDGSRVSDRLADAARWAKALPKARSYAIEAMLWYDTVQRSLELNRPDPLGKEG